MVEKTERSLVVNAVRTMSVRPDVAKTYALNNDAMEKLCHIADFVHWITCKYKTLDVEYGVDPVYGSSDNYYFIKVTLACMDFYNDMHSSRRNKTFECMDEADIFRLSEGHEGSMVIELGVKDLWRMKDGQW